MRVLARKKIVFVIVEGPSDQDALELLLNKIFDRDRVFVHVTYGDITSKAGNTPANILKKVQAEVGKYAKNNHFEKSHFKEVIHIIDTDGTYVVICQANMLIFSGIKMYKSSGHHDDSTSLSVRSFRRYESPVMGTTCA